MAAKFILSEKVKENFATKKTVLEKDQDNN